MIPLLCYPVPAESRLIWNEFRPFVSRFTDSIHKFPGQCTVAMVVSWNSGSEVKPEEIYELATCFPENKFVRLYDGHGCDIGGAQNLSKDTDPERLMIMLTTRCYFHRAGWLERYVSAHEKDPDALLSASASWEGGRRHICTRGYAMRAGLFASYPVIVSRREEGHQFEVGVGGLTDWFVENERHCLQVTFDGVQEQPDWRKPENIFRKGDQSNMLVWDKHTDIYANASIEEKHRLKGIADGPS